MNRGAERVRKGRSRWAGTVWMAAEAAGVSGGGLDSAHFLSLGWSAWYSSGVGGSRQWAPASYPPAWACHPRVPGMSMATPGSSESKGSTPELQNNPETPRSPQKLCTGRQAGSTKQLQAEKSRSRSRWEGGELLSQETQPLAEALLGASTAASFNWFNLKKNVSAEEAFRRRLN